MSLCTFVRLSTLALGPIALASSLLACSGAASGGSGAADAAPVNVGGALHDGGEDAAAPVTGSEDGGSSTGDADELADASDATSPPGDASDASSVEVADARVDASDAGEPFAPVLTYCYEANALVVQWSPEWDGGANLGAPCTAGGSNGGGLTTIVCFAQGSGKCPPLSDYPTLSTTTYTQVVCDATPAVLGSTEPTPYVCTPLP